MAEAQKTADSWEGRLNRLTNTWNSFIGNFVDTDLFKGAITSGENFLKLLDKFSLALPSTAAGITAFALSLKKNTGISNEKYARLLQAA